jgi:hypothetical protein
MTLQPVDIFLPQVTRIPIAGPAPYNTLVIVSDSAFLDTHGNMYGTSSETFYGTVSVPTYFVLAGFDQRVPPQYMDTISVTVTATGASMDDDFLFAADAIAGSGFDPVGGGYYVNVNTAIRIPDNMIPQTPIIAGGYLVGTRLQITSFVLVYEPPIATPPGQGTGDTSYSEQTRRRVPEKYVARLPGSQPTHFIRKTAARSPVAPRRSS